MIVTLLLVGILFIWIGPRRPILVAVAKGGRLFYAADVLEAAVDQSIARDIALSDNDLSEGLEAKEWGFLYANPLTTSQKRNWSSFGCDLGGCAQVTFYNYSNGGTHEAVVNLASSELLDSWHDLEARPSASPFIVPRAVSIANSDRRVNELLGNLRETQSMMAPMSTWLTDDECRVDRCVDLTYAAPDSSSRIFHVLVNMERQSVARLFYTRDRADRVYKQPAAQGARFNNDCHEEYGWQVYWEMTANDGVDFYDVTFEDDLIFSSAKIGQVEVYYPSWPGGYRDEIGYSASVHPYYGTNVSDLGNGFEVRQLFTEFLRWPKCDCCYRYEQIMRFFDDGAFDMEVISHGPGCDELSTYRPFWRLDLDIGDSISNKTLYLADDGWQQAVRELEIPLFSDFKTEALSPSGHRLYTEADGIAYLLTPSKTDPIGQDEGRLFILREYENEGKGIITTGQADTFWLPGQWLDRERLSGENIVIWYIPILSTKQGDPWWCMPDPGPDFSPCHALLSVNPTEG